MKKILVLLIFASFGLSAEIYKCVDDQGKITFSDEKECLNPDKVKIPKKTNSGKKAYEKITFRNANELRSSPKAIKLSFDKKMKYSVFSYYEGFYIINSDHISIYVDKVLITKTPYGSMKEVNLESIQFALVSSTKFGSDENNWIYSEIYEIDHHLKVNESVSYENIGFEIPIIGYELDDLSQYKIAGIIANDEKYSNPILSDNFLVVSKE